MIVVLVMALSGAACSGTDDVLGQRASGHHNNDRRDYLYNDEHYHHEHYHHCAATGQRG